MRAGIITVPERKETLKKLLEIVAPEIPRIKIYRDFEHRGPWWNYWRMFVEMVGGANVDEPIILFNDDALPSRGFRKAWEEIHSRAQSDIYSLFALQKHLFTPENLNRGYVTKVQRRGFYTQGTVYINQQELPRKIKEWFTNAREEDLSPRLRMIRKRAYKALDVVIQDYLVYHDIPWTITIPTLVDHQKVKSTLGHSIGTSPKQAKL